MKFASLLTATNAEGHVHLIVAGPNSASQSIASSRVTRSLDVGAHPVLSYVPTPNQEAQYHSGLDSRLSSGVLSLVDGGFQESSLYTLGRQENGSYVDVVFVCFSARDPEALRISLVCKRHRVPVNVLDSPSLCTFSLLSVHTDGPLQIGITTNSSGCALSSRIRREIVAALPKDLGAACKRFGTARRKIIEEDSLAQAEVRIEDEEDKQGQEAAFNKLVLGRDDSATKDRRIRWFSQLCEYWPLSRLTTFSDDDIRRLMDTYHSLPSVPYSNATEFIATIDIAAITPPLQKRGLVILAGSGPGHPDLITRATHKAILSADLILADKLIPAGVLSLIPRRTALHIARKFPGNAEKAQEELLSLALAGLEEGKIVLRLKQGDPYLYGRGGEEVQFFEKKGYRDRVRVLPGVTSALSAPLFAKIPVTNRGVADQVLVCTGTGRAGARLLPPECVPKRTVIFLMALHRIGDLVEDLTTYAPETHIETEKKARKLYPSYMPCAVIERASCPDQRVIRTTLAHVVAAIEEEGSRPPGLLVVGKACETLWTPQADKRWTVEEGFEEAMLLHNDIE